MSELKKNDQGDDPDAENPKLQETSHNVETSSLWGDVKQPVDAQGNGPYVPGSLTEPEHRHESYDLLVKNAVEEVHGPQEDEHDRFWRKVAENAKLKESEPDSNNDASQENMRDHHPRNKIQRQDPITKLPIVNVPSGYHHARKMHMDNLEHQPLPDTLAHRYLSHVGQHRDSDIVVKPYAIGWKGYGASGPTTCTKMRVHRPKTCDAKTTAEKENVDQTRPATSVLANKKPMSRMDLAICWDYRPLDPTQEPKPPKHIDGSNGSKAPAVFTMVHTPKEEQLMISAHPNPIFTQNCLPEDMEPQRLPYFEKDMSKNRRKDSCEVQNCPQHSQCQREIARHENSRSRKSSSQSASSRKLKQCDGIHGCGTPTEASQESIREKINIKRADKLNPIKDPWIRNQDSKTLKKDRKNLSDTDGKRNSLESYDKTLLAQGKLYQSSPDVSNASRSSKEGSNNDRHKNCQSCNGVKPHVEVKPKDDFKSAFKAGNPNSVQSSSSSGSGDSKALRIPKMRDPYAKKSYSIPTLAPPFCIWRDTSNSGYPEHWRLATVYQHTYKRPEQRRKPLIATVFQ